MSDLQNEEQEAGYHEVKFDGSGLATGVYFYRLSVSPLARRAGPIYWAEPRSAEADRDLVPTDGRDGRAGTYVQTRKLLLLR